jgi:glucose/arabinose dehydrogenase
MTSRLIPRCALLAAAALLAGCYAVRPSGGGGETHASTPRRTVVADIALPQGYRIEPVATGLSFPSGVTFGPGGQPYVVESGYSYGEVWTSPRLVRIEPNGSLTVIATGDTKAGPWNGVTYDDGAFFVAEGGAVNGGRLLRIDAKGNVTPLILDLPSLGDHHTNGPVVGKDGWVYFGQGTATNSAVVGPDAADFGWLKRHPEFHDVPCEDVTLAGDNFESRDPLHEGQTARTGPYSAFGTTVTAGQVIRGRVPCSGAVMRVKASGGEPELVAWGFRNPFGLAFRADGTLFVTDNGFDERGSRPLWGAGDLLWSVKSRTWYGWPDYSGDRPVADFKPPLRGAVRPVLQKAAGVPPRPAAVFAVHSSSSGFDFSRSASFGFAGQAFVAQFGDMSPSVGKVLHPVGFKVVRVDPDEGVVRDFAVNRGKTNGPASRSGAGGLERPVSVRFDPAGTALYVVDFGVMTVGSQGPAPVPGTGVLWRIRKAGS